MRAILARKISANTTCPPNSGGDEDAHSKP
jgi:hypothetical protein